VRRVAPAACWSRSNSSTARAFSDTQWSSTRAAGVDYGGPDPRADRSSALHPATAVQGRWALQLHKQPREAGAEVVSSADPSACRRLPACAESTSRAQLTCSTRVGRSGGADIFIQRRRWLTIDRQPRPNRRSRKLRIGMDLSMERTTDVLATVAARPDRPFVVGFAAETESVEQHARGKLAGRRTWT